MNRMKSKIITLAGSASFLLISVGEPISYAANGHSSSNRDKVINETLLSPERPPSYLPDAKHYPKPPFFGTVQYHNPSWNGPSALPCSMPKVWDGMPPLREFTITQSWTGKLSGKYFILDTYADFNPHNHDNAKDGAIIGLRYGSRITEYYSEQGMTLVGFYGTLAVWFTRSNGHMMAIDIKTGRQVQHTDRVVSLVLPTFPATQNQIDDPKWYKWVHGIKEHVLEYPVDSTLQMEKGSQNSVDGKKYMLEAWNHSLRAIGRCQ